MHRLHRGMRPGSRPQAIQECINSRQQLHWDTVYQQGGIIDAHICILLCNQKGGSRLPVGEHLLAEMSQGTVESVYLTAQGIGGVRWAI
jgi:hypothetical protein